MNQTKSRTLHLNVILSEISAQRKHLRWNELSFQRGEAFVCFYIYERGNFEAITINKSVDPFIIFQNTLPLSLSLTLEVLAVDNASIVMFTEHVVVILILFCIILLIVPPSSFFVAIKMCKVLQLNLTGTNRISDGWRAATVFVIEFFSIRKGSAFDGMCRWRRVKKLTIFHLLFHEKITHRATMQIRIPILSSPRLLFYNLFPLATLFFFQFQLSPLLSFVSDSRGT